MLLPYMECLLSLLGCVISVVSIWLISTIILLYQVETGKRRLKGGIIFSFYHLIMIELLVFNGIVQSIQLGNDLYVHRIPLGL